jgi:SAM-dependent methyltransferase
MAQVITYQHCPVCKSNNIHPVLSAKDHTVSNETFEIWECTGCTLRFTQNIPPADAIGRYYQSADYVSHSDTKKGVVNQLYHLVRSITLRSKRKLVENMTTLKQGNLLDVGAGTGAFAAAMQKAGWNVKGLEPDAIARQNAKAHHRLELETLEALHQQPAAHYDAITMWHVLEHVHDLHQYINTFHRILKTTGTLIVAVPNYTSADAEMYKEDWAAYDVPRHLYHFSPHSIDILMEQHQMQVVAHKPMWFDSVYVSMLSEKYKNGSTSYANALLNGELSNSG